MDWLDLLAVQGTLKSLFQQHSSKTSILRPSAFFMVQLSHPYTTTRKTIALTQFSRVRLFATPWTVTCKVPLSMRFPRQEHWSGLPFPSPMHECEVAQSCPTVHSPMDCTLPGSALHGIFQARVLGWGTIAFSERAS